MTIILSSEHKLQGIIFVFIYLSLALYTLKLQPSFPTFNTLKNSDKMQKSSKGAKSVDGA